MIFYSTIGFLTHASQRPIISYDAAMLFRQLIDLPSSTFTYLLADGATREAVLIDPVFEQSRATPRCARAWA